MVVPSLRRIAVSVYRPGNSKVVACGIGGAVSTVVPGINSRICIRFRNQCERILGGAFMFLRGVEAVRILVCLGSWFFLRGVSRLAEYNFLLCFQLRLE